MDNDEGGAWLQGKLDYLRLRGSIFYRHLNEKKGSNKTKFLKQQSWFDTNWL